MTDLLPPSLGRLHPVGRLDFNTEGLLLLTNDGEFTNFVTAARNRVEKVYEVKVKGVPAEAGIQRLRRGVTLDDGTRTAPAKITKLNETQTNAWYEVALHQGRNQQVRRMFELIGHSVLKLRRTRIGFLSDDNLKPGRYRLLSPAEVKRLTKPRASLICGFGASLWLKTITMHFELTEEQQQIKMSVREFAESEIAPHVMEWDESQHFPVELQPKLAELGLLGVLFPEEYGGAGMGYVEYATIIEELSRVDGSVGISVAAHNSLCSNHIYQYGTEEQRQKYLAPLASGEHLGAWGLTEPSAGSDASGTKSTAVRTDGGWIVNGSKNFITHAIHADTCVAMAVTDKSKRSKGISAFIFEKGMKGFSPSKKENKLGLRASETASVVFEDCFVPDGQLLGEEGQGFVNSMEILDGGRISIAALAVGIAQGAYESAVQVFKGTSAVWKTDIGVSGYPV